MLLPGIPIASALVLVIEVISNNAVAASGAMNLVVIDMSSWSPYFQAKLLFRPYALGRAVHPSTLIGMQIWNQIL